MPQQNIFNLPNRHSFMKSGQAGMIMSGMQHQSRIAVVGRSNVLAQIVATFGADVLTSGARIEFIFDLQNGVYVMTFPISDAIAGNNANITTALLAALRSDPRVNGGLTFSATSTATEIVLTVTGRFANQPMDLTVQGVSASGAIVPNFATYSGVVQPMDDRTFMMSGLYPIPGLIVAADTTPVGGVQTVKLPNAASDRIIGVVERRDPVLAEPFMTEMLEVMVEGDIRPWLENYATADNNVPAYRFAVDGVRSQLGAVVCVPQGDPAPAGTSFFPDRLNARFVRSKSDGTVTLAIGN